MSKRRAERESHWREVLADQAASGLSVAAYCRRASISPPSFYAWKRRLAAAHPAPRGRRRRAADVDLASPSQIVPVRIEASGAATAVRIFLPQGICLEWGGGETALRNALAALAEARLC